VLGSVGLPATLLIVTMSVAITLLTGFSISAMATNMKVGGGGAYYMISRTLGLEVGAAVGLPLFLAQALGIAFYIAGFSETVVGFFPWLSPVVAGLATLALLTLLAYLSADLALKTQYVILTLLLLSLVSLFLGGGDLGGRVLGEPLPAGTFWVAFAVFFPAVTGIEAGLGMSGDLKNPARALPLGTLGAVAVGYAIYIAIPVFLAGTVGDRDALLADPLIMTRVARWSMLVVLGILGASLSSAMGALLGAPRTLQALAEPPPHCDRVTDDPILQPETAPGLSRPETFDTLTTREPTRRCARRPSWVTRVAPVQVRARTLLQSWIRPQRVRRPGWPAPSRTPSPTPGSRSPSTGCSSTSPSSARRPRRPWPASSA
jgi:amino acid transporter